jgi:hypothetical protein
VTDRRGQMLATARPELVDAFADDGVLRVEYVSAFPDQDDLAVWLGTATDSEADRLRQQQGLRDRVSAMLSRAGFTGEQLEGLLVVIQSQETVDREYAGSWFYALR